MNKLFTYIIIGATMLGFTGCTSLDLEPTSSITDANYWKTAAHYSAFNVGLHAKLRETSFNIFLLGEPRADIYSGTQSYYGGAPQGNQYIYNNQLSIANTGVSNYAGMYVVINQINLMIEKTINASILDESTKSYYLGEAYGMRAYLYFHLLRSWGDVILTTQYTNGSTLNIGNLSKGVSPATEVMAQIKADIKSSEDYFGDQTTFKFDRHFWSKAATLMLKAEAYLWSGNQMGGGNTDFTTAKNTLLSLTNNASVLKLNLIPSFEETFAYAKKNNNEIIFAIRNQLDEYNLWDDNYRINMSPVSTNQVLYYDENHQSFSTLEAGKYNGTIRFPMTKELYTQLYNDKDTRKRGTMKAVYEKKAGAEGYEFIGIFAYKFKGTLKAGASLYTNADDYPIYRYADCLLLLAQAKAFLGEDISAEINAIRERAYGQEYFNANRSTLAYPNDNDAAFYTNNPFVEADNKGALATVLKERMREFITEGKRWYDLRLAGNTYVTKHSKASLEQLLWPIDSGTLTNNTALEQTPGYIKKTN